MLENDDWTAAKNVTKYWVKFYVEGFNARGHSDITRTFRTTQILDFLFVV